MAKFKIPNQLQEITQPNDGDFGASLRSTRNINLMDKCLIKLAPRAVTIFNQSNVTGGTFHEPVAVFGGFSDTDMFVVTNSDIYEGNILSTGNSLGIITDTNSNVSGSIIGDVMPWNGSVYISTSNNICYRTTPTSSAYNIAFSGLDSSSIHSLEHFVNRATLVCSDGTRVVQIKEDLSVDKQLNIPKGYKVNGLAYNAMRMGIIANFTSGNRLTIDQSAKSIFFVWDGNTTSANLGYEVGSETAIGVVPYKSSWVVLTSKGELLYFNGGGFTPLAQLPSFSDKFQQSFNYASRKPMLVDGDKIYVNVCSYVLDKFNRPRYDPNMAGGIWCYDASNSLYHYASPSDAMVEELHVTGMSGTGGVTASTYSSVTGTQVVCYVFPNASTGEMVSGVTYYLIRVSSTEFKLARSRAEALAGTSIVIPTLDSSAHFFALTETDYGFSLIAGNYSLGKPWYGALLAISPMFGSTNTNNDSGHTSINVLSHAFNNAGHFVTHRFPTEGVQSISSKVFIKHRTLSNEDTVIVKHRSTHISGLPAISCVGAANYCTWASQTTITVPKYSVDLSAAIASLAAGVELECEIISGSGSGTYYQVQSIASASSTVYTVTLATAAPMTVSGTCNIVIDNWTTLSTPAGTSVITASNQEASGTYQLDINNKGAWHQFKVLLTGIETTIEELTFVTSETDKYES